MILHLFTKYSIVLIALFDCDFGVLKRPLQVVYRIKHVNRQQLDLLPFLLASNRSLIQQLFKLLMIRKNILCMSLVDHLIILSMTSSQVFLRPQPASRHPSKSFHRLGVTVASSFIFECFLPLLNIIIPILDKHKRQYWTNFFNTANY